MESSSPFRPVLQQTLNLALDQLDKAHVGTTASYAELRERLWEPVINQGLVGFCDPRSKFARVLQA